MKIKAKTILLSSLFILTIMLLLLVFIIYSWGFWDWELWRSRNQLDGLVILVLPYIYLPSLAGLGLILILPSYRVLKKHLGLRTFFYVIIPIGLIFLLLYSNIWHTQLLLIALLAQVGYIFFDGVVIIKEIKNNSAIPSSSL